MNNGNNLETIFSLITSPNAGSVAVIRISGHLAFLCLNKIGISEKPMPNSINFCKIYYINNQKEQQDQQNNRQILDEVLISFFKAPNSFTGEDVAEINLHNSPFIIKKIFTIFSQINGVRIAQAGEFSKRAFLNGKIDLTQAEAIADLISSQSEAQHSHAMLQLSGKVSQIYDSWCEKIIQITALIEASIDFPEDDLPTEIVDFANLQVKNLQTEIENQLAAVNIANKIKNGIEIAIIGMPNVGKSSLINYLAQTEVAIVSNMAGTTRDLVQTQIEIGKMKVTIFDSAGIRKAKNKIEAKGIELAMAKAQAADFVIIMAEPQNYGFLQENCHLIKENSLILINKIDKIAQNNLQNQRGDLLNCQNYFNQIVQLLPNYENYFKENLLFISIKCGVNLQNLVTKIENKILQHFFQKENNAILSNQRHIAALRKANESLHRFNLENNIEIVAEELRIAVAEIGKITGKNIGSDNILDHIFSKFCIGK